MIYQILQHIKSQRQIFIENTLSYYLVKEMENPEFPSFNIEKAMKALQEYKEETEEMRCEGLTDKQASALINLTKELLPHTKIVI